MSIFARLVTNSAYIRYCVSLQSAATETHSLPNRVIQPEQHVLFLYINFNIILTSTHSNVPLLLLNAACYCRLRTNATFLNVTFNDAATCYDYTASVVDGRMSLGHLWDETDSGN